MDILLKIIVHETLRMIKNLFKNCLDMNFKELRISELQLLSFCLCVWPQKSKTNILRSLKWTTHICIWYYIANAHKNLILMNIPQIKLYVNQILLGAYFLSGHTLNMHQMFWKNVLLRTWSGTNLHVQVQCSIKSLWFSCVSSKKRYKQWDENRLVDAAILTR